MEVRRTPQTPFCLRHRRSLASGSKPGKSSDRLFSVSWPKIARGVRRAAERRERKHVHFREFSLRRFPRYSRSTILTSGKHDAEPGFFTCFYLRRSNSPIRLARRSVAIDRGSTPLDWPAIDRVRARRVEEPKTEHWIHVPRRAGQLFFCARDFRARAADGRADGHRHALVPSSLIVTLSCASSFRSSLRCDAYDHAPATEPASRGAIGRIAFS